jgi:uncharacterized phiE125 gp8 family phage protein
MSLITLEEIKAFLKAPPTSEQENILENLIEEVSAAIESYCGRSFEEAERMEYCDGSGIDVILLRHFPVSDVDSVTLVGADGSKQTVDADLYWLYGEAGILKIKNGTWLKGSKNYEVVYTAGYVASEIPKDLKLACKIWTAILLEEIDRNLFAVQSTQIGDQTVTYDLDEIPKKVKQLLQRWVRAAYG